MMNKERASGSGRIGWVLGGRRWAKQQAVPGDASHNAGSFPPSLPGGVMCLEMDCESEQYGACGAGPFPKGLVMGGVGAALEGRKPPPFSEWYPGQTLLGKHCGRNGKATSTPRTPPLRQKHLLA
jgi:hypothetical protein